MMWKKYKICDIATVLSGATPATSDLANYDGEIVWITPKDLALNNSKYISRGERNLTEKGYKGCSTQLIPPYNILMSSRAPIGLLAINRTECCTNQGFKNLVIDKSICDVDFFYYYLKYHIAEVQALGSGTTFKEVSKSSLQSFVVSLPSLDEQKQIANILSTLDEKIALNRQINDNLEAMARQLYDYWFVQFDFSDENGRPYKSSGGKMVWNEKLKQNIPMGWIVEDISKIADVYNGATPSTKEERNYGGNIVWITPKDLSDQKSKFVYYGERNITQKGYDSCSTHMLPIGTVLMSSRAPIGLLSIAKSELCTNQGFKSFVPKKETLGSYLYYYILLHIKQIEQLGTGTTFKEISRDDVMTYPILVPKEELLNKWAEFVFPIDNRQFEIQQENKKLTKQRDELLPLLMNGQVSVNYHLQNL